MESDRPLTAATIATPEQLKVQDTAHWRSYRAQGMLDAAHYLQAQTWVICSRCNPADPVARV